MDVFHVFMLDRVILQHVLSDLSYFPVVGIIGPRQVGKTTLAKQVQKLIRPERESLFLDLELPADRSKLSDAEVYLAHHQDKCVAIDEVQRMPELFPLLRALVDMDRRPARFILLGSASPELIKGSSETLAGRIAYTELTPFSLLESAPAVSMDHHWLFGGFPGSMLAPRPSLAWRWMESFVHTFIQRDLQELGHHVSPALITRMLTMIATLHGKLLNQSDLARSLGVSQPTVNRYLDLLEGGFIIGRLRPFSANIGKRMVRQPRLYIRDSGLLHHLLGILEIDQLLGHAAIGASWEGYVVEQIRRVGAGRVKLYFWRTHQGAESDLVLVFPNGEIYCLEIKRSASASISRGFHEVITDVKPSRAYVIIPSGETYPGKNNIWMSDLQRFLAELAGKINTMAA